MPHGTRLLPTSRALPSNPGASSGQPLEWIEHQAKRTWRQLLDLVFPPRCVSCHKLNDTLCAECLARAALVEPPVCEQCGSALPFPGSPCPERHVHPWSLTASYHAAWHEGPVREAVHALKYDHRLDVARPLAHLLLRRVQWAHAEYDWITAVPLHPLRMRERGYNQAQLLAEELARLTGRPFMEALYRTRMTQDQVGLDREARRRNVAHAFDAADAPIAQARILLIDDVCTTGATLDGCASVLMDEGAQAILGLTVTRPRF